MEVKAPLRIEVKSSWQPYGCGKWISSIWRTVKAGLSAVMIPFREETLILRQLKRQYSRFQRKTAGKDRILCFDSKVHQNSVHFIQKCLFIAIKNVWVKSWLNNWLPQIAVLVYNLDWSWHVHCQQRLLEMGIAKIQKKKAIAVGQTGPPMWITDVLLKHSHFSESFECLNTSLVVLLSNSS